MRYLIIGFAALFLTSCSHQQPVPVQPQPPTVLEVPVAPAQPVPVQPVIPHSTAWVRGYNDGYDGNWLGPGSWVVSNEYRAGWSAGNRDRKDGNPHRLNR
jgi:hypothetical protein